MTTVMELYQFRMLIRSVITSIFGICSLLVGSFCYPYSIPDPQRIQPENSSWANISPVDPHHISVHSSTSFGACAKHRSIQLFLFAIYNISYI